MDQNYKHHHHHHHHHHHPPFLQLVLKRRQSTLLLSILFLLLSFLFCINAIAPFQLHPFLTRLFSYRTKQACDYSNGRWVWDESLPLQSYKEDCPFLDPGFRCHENGRRDDGYVRWRWKPHGCNLPRFNATDMLERNRNGRIVFAGDSIGRNQWESLLCMLAQGVSNKSSIYERNGRPITKHKGFLAMRFDSYNLSVEYYRVPFLVIPDRPPQNSSNEIKIALRVDKLHWRSKQWIGANVLIFNAGHWWNQEKTLKMGCYFQEGAVVNISMNIQEAFRKSLQTWKQWAMKNLDSKRSHVIFRSYSPVHYKGGTWDNGGRCDYFKAPRSNYSQYQNELWNNQFISKTIGEMKNSMRKADFLNITYLTDLRSDGHPSLHREPGTPVPIRQDCSHWCLPGVPDVWNELLYAHLLLDHYNTKTHRMKIGYEH